MRANRDREWANWAGNVRGRPARWLHPASPAELQEVIAAASAEAAGLRPVGSGHSFAALAAPSDWLVQLDRMRAVLDVDRRARTVTVQAGIRLTELGDALAREELALPILGTAADETVAGAVATATHGTGSGFGTLSTLVERRDARDRGRQVARGGRQGCCRRCGRTSARSASSPR